MPHLSGQISVTSAGTAVQGPDVAGRYFALKAHPANVGTVWFGNDGSDDVDSSSGFPQLVANASAELGTSEPDDWFHTLTGTQWGTQGHGDNRSLRVTVAGDLADWRCRVYPVAGGRKYRVGLWVKGSGAPEMILAARWFSDIEGATYITEQWLILDGVYPDWTPMSHIITAPPNAVSGDLMFRAAFATTADLYGDDFSVRRLN